MSSEPAAAEFGGLPLTRRVVTGHDENAKSRVLYDDTEGHVQILPSGSGRFQTLWLTDDVPADCSSATDNDPMRIQQIGLSNEGSICRIVWTRPGASSPMHRTKTIDYGVVLDGEIELELDNGEKRLLKTGDVVVQRETMHAWHNPHATKWSKVMFVGVNAKDTKDTGVSTASG